MRTIRSRDNPLFKQLLRLSQSSRERKQSGKTVLDGVHLIEAYRNTFGVPEALAVSASGSENSEVRALVSQLPLQAVLLSDALFGELSLLETPVGVLAIIDTPQPPSAPSHIDFCLLLEDIQDPGNFGSILRSAAGAGCRHVFASKGSAFAWAPRVLRAAMGAHFLVQIYEQADLIGIARRFDGKVVAAVPEQGAASLYQTDLTGNLALVVGNEGKGVSDALLRHASHRATIPLAGPVESLNAAAAAAICLFERARQVAALAKRPIPLLPPP
jgi:RNA methyltransferase, TrmH family